jgi:hypothetical protein
LTVDFKVFRVNSPKNNKKLLDNELNCSKCSSFFFAVLHLEKELCCTVGNLPDSIFLSKENKIDNFKNTDCIYYQKSNIPGQLSASGRVPKGYAFPDNCPGNYYIEYGAAWLKNL